MENNANRGWEPEEMKIFSMPVDQQQTQDIDNTLSGEEEIIPQDDDVEEGGLEDDDVEEGSLEDDDAEEGNLENNDVKEETADEDEIEEPEEEEEVDVEKDIDEDTADSTYKNAQRGGL